MFSNQQKQIKVFLAHVQITHAVPSDPQLYLAELEQLCSTLGVQVGGTEIVKLSVIHAAYYIGRGQAENLALQTEAAECDILIFNCDLRPLQIRNLEQICGIKIMCRPEVILEIFASHACTSEAKTQVEMARLKYMLPRLTGKGTVMSRLGGGIGTRGPGEKQIEYDRRHIRKRIMILKKRLVRISEQRNRQMNSRKMKIAVFVGYTNAGKTCLLQSLSGVDLRSKDALFVTLDPVLRRVWVGGTGHVLVSDTVGFIRNIPHDLIASFRATLGEVSGAGLIVHIMDGNCPDLDERKQTVESVLEELEARDVPELLVINKSDLLSSDGKKLFKKEWPDALLVSARSGEGLSDLRYKLGEILL